MAGRINNRRKAKPQKEAEFQEEVEFLVLDEDSFVELTEQVAGLEFMINEIKDEHEQLREQLEDLERRISVARYS